MRVVLCFPAPFVRYAIHNAGVGMSLRKAGESGVEVKTVTGNSIIDNIRIIYGPAIAKELVEFSMDDDKLKFSAKGQISNVNYHVKKFVFLLFINNRLVESSALKRAIESVYQPYLPKVTNLFLNVHVKSNIFRARHHLCISPCPLPLRTWT